MAESLNETFVIPANKGNEQLFSDDSLVAGDSTRSLLTPLFASDYESISKRLVYLLYTLLRRGNGDNLGPFSDRTIENHIYLTNNVCYKKTI